MSLIELFQSEHLLLQCHPVTWFLATLLQLTAIAPIFVIIYFKNELMGIFTLIMGIIMALFLAISPLIFFGIKPYLQIWDLDSVIFANSSSLTAYHTFPTVYLISFLTGFPFGYLLHKNKVKVSKTQVKMFWIMSLGAIFGVYFWNNSFWRIDHSAPLINALLWHTAGKLAFGLGVGWFLFACCTGRGGLVNLGALLASLPAPGQALLRHLFNTLLDHHSPGVRCQRHLSAIN